MECSEFRRAHVKFSSTPLEAEVVDSPEHDEYVEHLNDCGSCGDYFMEAEVRARGHQPDAFPCVHVAYYATFTCDGDEDPWECADAVLVGHGDPAWYGIPVRDGGTSSIQIKYCPWCGKEV